MRNQLARKTILGVAMLSALFAGPTLAQECGTRLLPQHAAIFRDRVASGVYDPPVNPADAYYVAMTFHVVRRGDGTGGISDAQLLDALDDANLGFSNAGIRFCWAGPIDYIDDDDFYYNIDTIDEIDALRSMNVVPDTINAYFTENLAYEGGPLCGISSFTFSDVQGIVMANQCAGTSDNPSSFPHEIGHYFDLFHTHETLFGWECPACSDQECSCNLAGDQLCDTPADPTLGDHNVNSSCSYFGSERDPCSDSLYRPDTSNLMSYSLKTCRTTFTNQQNFRMQATLTRLRPELIQPDCPGNGGWIVDAKLTASDGATSDGFGISVSLSDNVALIGAYQSGDNGAAYLYEKSNDVWVQSSKFTDAEGNQQQFFGLAVAISGGTALAGAFGDDDLGYVAGAAFVFEKRNGIWKQTAKLTGADGAWGDWFGRSVALSRERALIGAPQHRERGMYTGSAYVFEKSDGAWTQTAKLTASDGAQYDYFGQSVAISGDTAIIGAKLGYDGFDYVGAAYVFENINGVWMQTAKLDAPEGRYGDRFSASVSLASDVALIGAPGENGAGTAHVFEKTNGIWTQVAKLTDANAAAGDYFGYSVALSADRALIGSLYDDDRGTDAGSVCVFGRINGVWTQTTKMTAPDGAPGDNFGNAVAVSGDSALVAAYQDDDRGATSGSAYLFRRISRCGGQERVAKTKCADVGGSNVLTIVLSGGRVGDVFNVSLSTGGSKSGVVDDRGKAKVKFKALPSGDGVASAEWGCGATAQKPYSCP